MEFLNPAYLAALGAGAVPFLLHLIFRRRTPKLDFSTVRFLKEIDVRLARKRRLQEILVLLLRTGVILFLALALARPLWNPSGPAGSARGRTALVVVLDASPSMLAAPSGKSRFEEARAAALSMLDSLRPGDRASLFLPGSPDPFPAALDDDLERVRSACKNAVPAFGRFPLSEACARAADLLEGATEAHREIHLLSDFQRRSFGQAPPAGEDGPRLFLTDVGAPLENAFVVSARALDAPVFAGSPVEVAVAVSVSGSEGASVPVSFLADGKKVAERECTVKPGEEQNLSFTTTFSEAGIHLGEIRLASDALNADDAWFFTIRVHEPIPVLIVNGDPDPQGYRDEVFYVAAALGLEQTTGDRAPSRFRPVVVTPGELTGDRLDGTRVVILANTGPLDEEAARRLGAFVEAGGGLIHFPGDRSRPETRSGGPDPGLASLLPARIARVEGDPGGGTTPWTWVEVDEDHEIFNRFRGSSRLDFSGARFFRITRLEPEDEARVLAEHEGGLPALVEGKRGRGRVLQFSSTADMDWNTFPVRTSFLPLLYHCAFLLAGLEAEAEPTYPVGAVVPLDGIDRVLGPETGETRPEVPLSLEEDGSRVAGPLTAPGFHHAQLLGGPELPPETVNVLPVNTDRAEADTCRFPVEEAATWWGTERAVVLDPSQDPGATASRFRTGLELTGLFLALAAFCFALESFLSNRRREASKRSAAALPLAPEEA